MKRKDCSISSCFTRSPLELNETGVQFYRKMKLSDALNHFLMALNATHSMQEISQGPVMSKKLKMNTDSNILNTECDDFQYYRTFPSDKFERCTIRSQYDDGFDSFLNVLSIIGNFRDELSTILFNLGVVHQKMKKVEDALSYYYKSIASTHYVKYEFIIVANLCNIGNIHYIRKEFKQALKSFNKALKYGKHSQATMSSILNCIGCLKSKIDNRYEVSIQNLRESLQIKICLVGSLSHPDIAIILNNMGKIFLSNGKSTEAKQVFEKASSIRKKLYGDDSLKVAEVIKNLAVLYNLEGEDEKEENMHYKFLKIAHSNFIWIDLEVAKTFFYLGQLHQRSKRFDKAIEAYEKSALIYNIILGPNNQQAANLSNILGCLYYEITDTESAIHHFRQELLIEMKLYKKYNSKVISTLTILAVIYKEQEDYEYSLFFYRHILRAQERLLGRDHSDLSITFGNLGYILYQKGDFSESITMYQRALKIRYHVLSNNDIQSATILTQLGFSFIKLKKYFLALDALSKSIEIRKLLVNRKICHHDDEAVLTFSFAGMIHERFGDDEKALINYEKALEINTGILGCDHEEVARMLYRIGRVHMNMGAIDDHLEIALKILNMVLHIQRKRALDNSDEKLSMAHTMNCIGNVHFQKGEMDKSMQFFIEASRMHREAGVSDQNVSIFNSNSWSYEQHANAAAAAA